MEGIEERYPGSIEERKSALGEETITLKKEFLVPVCRYLKERGYNFLSDLTGLDLGSEKEPRYQVVYHLYAISTARRLRVKVNLDSREPAIESVTAVWKGANWFEREAYDLLGIRFKNHPDLTRILLPDGFEGHPLRKDYPVRGR